MRHATALLALLAVAACDGVHRIHADHTYLLPPGYPALADAAAECVALYAPHVPYQLSVQVGGMIADGESGTPIIVVESIALRADEQGRVRSPSGVHDRETDTIDIARSATRGGRDTLRVACHEIGHSLGLEHSDCAGGVMSHGSRATRPGACEFGRLEEIYR
jgi:hypothetical protein